MKLFRGKFDLKWYECVWVMLPMALVAVGGAIGGACGAAALGFNMWLMRRWRHGWWRYPLAAASTAAAVVGYFLVAKLVMVTFGLSRTAMTPASLDRDLAATPSLVAVSKADPDAFARMRNAMLDAAAKGRPQTEIVAIPQATIGAMVRKYLPHASDQAVLDFTRVMTLETDQIGAKNADACVGFLYPQLGRMPGPVSDFITQEVSQHDVAATQAVIESGATSPVPVPTREAVAASIAQVRGALVSMYGAEDVAALARPATLPHDRLCAISSAVYNQALLLPKPTAISVLRYLFAQSQSVATP